MIFIISIIFVCLDSLLTALCVLMVITIHCGYFCVCVRANVLCTRCSKRIKLISYKQQATHASYAHMKNRSAKCIFWRDMIFFHYHYFCLSNIHSTRRHCYCCAILQETPPPWKYLLAEGSCRPFYKRPSPSLTMVMPQRGVGWISEGVGPTNNFSKVAQIFFGGGPKTQNRTNSLWFLQFLFQSISLWGWGPAALSPPKYSSAPHYTAGGWGMRVWRV